MQLSPRIKYWLKKNNYLYAHLLLQLVLSVFACIVLSGPLYSSKLLCNDTMGHYHNFHNTLYALNHFQEFVRWNPNHNMGFPMYYFSTLRVNNFNPAYLVIAYLMWAVGLLGIGVSTIYPIYVLYFGLISPLLFSFSIYFLARQILTHPKALLFVVITSSFSPPTLLILTDIGVTENATYGIFFAAAYLHFLNHPSKRSLLLLALTIAIMANTLCLPSLVWNIFFVPLFIITIYMIRDNSNLLACKICLKGIPLTIWVLVGLAIALPLSTFIATYIQGVGSIETKMAGGTYNLADLKSGNPLELLL